MSKVTKRKRVTTEVLDGFRCDYCTEFMQCDTITVEFGFGCDKDTGPDEHYDCYNCLGEAYLRYVSEPVLLAELNRRGYAFTRLRDDEYTPLPANPKFDHVVEQGGGMITVPKAPFSKSDCTNPYLDDEA